MRGVGRHSHLQGQLLSSPSVLERFVLHSLRCAMHRAFLVSNIINVSTSCDFSALAIGLAVSMLESFMFATCSVQESSRRLIPLRFRHPVLFLALPLA